MVGGLVKTIFSCMWDILLYIFQHVGYSFVTCEKVVVIVMFHMNSFHILVIPI